MNNMAMPFNCNVCCLVMTYFLNKLIIKQYAHPDEARPIQKGFHSVGLHHVIMKLLSPERITNSPSSYLPLDMHQISGLAPVMESALKTFSHKSESCRRPLNIFFIYSRYAPCPCPGSVFLEFRIIRSTWERYDITDILHASNEQNQTLEAETEASMRA